MKNVTDFRKTVETGVDPCLLCMLALLIKCRQVKCNKVF